MRVVMLVNADSIFCKEYVEHVLLGKYEVLIISNRNKRYRNYYRANGIEVLHWTPSPTFVGRLTDGIANKIKKDDIFHVHYVEPRTLKYLWIPWIKCKKRILTYWGSDLLRHSDKQIRSLWPFLYTADEIIVLNSDMQRRMKTKVSKIKWNSIKRLDFGNSIFDHIEEVSRQMSINECKQYLDLPDDKTIVSVGYNSIREQQHLEMMREVVKLPKELLANMFFVFHFGYGVKTTSYIKQLYELLQENNVQYKVIERFLEKREIAILRLGTDIFLYGQTTDAHSESVIEYLYAGSVLIKPKWLDYSDIKGVSYYEYGRFEEIEGILESLMEKGIRRMWQNKEPLIKQKSWSVFVPKWRALYKEKPGGK